jgi:anti-anti-sigma factor
VGAGYRAVSGGFAMTELSFEVNVDGGGDVVVLVKGEVDMATAPQLAACLDDHTDRDVVVDLSEVPFLDSSGISVLVHARQVSRERGHTLRVTGEQENVRTVLEVTGLLESLHGDGSRPAG